MHHQQPCGVPTAFDKSNANYIPRRKKHDKMSANRRKGGYLHDKLTENDCCYTFIVSIKRLC